MRSLWPLAVGALVFCSITAACAAPSFFGDTGLILTPNALVAERHTVTPQWHSVSGEFGHEEDNNSGDWDSMGALLGLTDRLELYLGFFSYDDQPFSSYPNEQDEFNAHIKAQALREPDDCLNLAIGIRNMGRDTRGYDAETDPTAYIVATKTVSGSEEEQRYLRLSAGMQFANEDDFLNEELWGENDRGDFDQDSLFGSAEWRICRRAALMAEIQEVGSHTINYGARLNPLDDVAVDVLLIDDPIADEHEFAFGVSGAWPFDLDPLGAPEDRNTSHCTAAPSHFGDTGMILMPNAMVAPRHTATPTYHSIAGGIGEDESVGDIGNWKNAGLRVGATDRLEVYAGLLAFDDDPFDEDKYHEDSFVMHAKAQALREPEHCCNLAVGVRNIGLDTAGQGDNEASAYVVASKTLLAANAEDDPSFLRTSVGLLLANEDGFLNEEYFPYDDDAPNYEYESCSLFGGVEWRLGHYVTLLGEVIEVGTDEAAFNWGFRLNPSSAFNLDVFLVDDPSQNEHELGWGGSYRIDF